MTLAESVTDALTGFALAMVLTMTLVPWLFGAPAPAAKSLVSVSVFTIASILRRYITRRVFEWLRHDRGIN